MQTQLEKVSEETMRFMRGKYVADEVSNGKDELKFRRGGKTILTIYIRKNYFDFMLIFGKAERAKFEQCREGFPPYIQNIYDNSKTYHDGKWMMFSVSDLEMLEEVKQLILIKKRPNRKPFPKEGAIYSKCGMRCDLCVHYTGSAFSNAFRTELQERIRRVYGMGENEEFPRCDGCDKGGISQKSDCSTFASCQPQAGLPGKVEAKSISADDVTWAILPYVYQQYGN